MSVGYLDALATEFGMPDFAVTVTAFKELHGIHVKRVRCWMRFAANASYGRMMPIRVQVSPRPIVIDDHGLPVANSHVIEILFPTEASETQKGSLQTVVGAGIAKVLIGEVTHRGVGLC